MIASLISYRRIFEDKETYRSFFSLYTRRR